jgi:hypothetical protein
MAARMKRMTGKDSPVPGSHPKMKFMTCPKRFL